MAKRKKPAPRATPDPKGRAPQNRRRRQGGKGRPFPKANKLGQKFKPGVSGNPGGRPRNLGEHREACRELSADVRDRFHEILAKGADKDALVAGRELWANAWGKPAQRVEVSGPGGEPMKVTYDDVRQKLSELASKTVATAVANAAGPPTDEG